ncbi:hypothetical protein [Streptomyces sp. G-G2]|nr:hypothetical protein [Streptomyces sp. G-G2]MDJ0386350.1 hypothetical protein [Streptomyces sp. G-G2]
MTVRKKVLETEERLREIGADYLQDVADLRQQAVTGEEHPDGSSPEED